MFPGRGLVGFRDPYGIKPLVYGKRLLCDGRIDYMFSSESCALDKLGFEDVCDVQPGNCPFCSPSHLTKCSRYIGEAVFMDGSKPRIFQIYPGLSHSLDVFELVYFARPESVIDGINVHVARRNIGLTLARTLEQKFGSDGQRCESTFDVVIPVPETSVTSALALANYLRLPYSHALTRNAYIFRTFLLPTHKKRLKAVWRKLTALKEEFSGRKVLIVDDSIVRGTTSREIVKMARAAGAVNVHVASCSPPIR